MKFAVVEGARREAEPGLIGQCPACGAPVIAKCGERKIRVWHWAHRAAYSCDPWREGETDWHRTWKNYFPDEWQEFIHSDGGEKHVADVKTQSGLVIEFQHSFLPQGKRLARETFYRNMIWVVDGRKRKRDRAQFSAALKAADVASLKPPVFAVSFPSEVALLRDWLESRVPVYFDFGDSEEGDALQFATPILWRLDPIRRDGKAYLTTVMKAGFLHVHLEGPFEKGCSESVAGAVASWLARRDAPPPVRLPQFERFGARQQRARAWGPWGRWGR